MSVVKILSGAFEYLFSVYKYTPDKFTYLDDLKKISVKLPYKIEYNYFTHYPILRKKKIKYNEKNIKSFDLYLYNDQLYFSSRDESEEKILLLIMDLYDSENRRFERLKNKFSGNKQDNNTRVRISESVRIEVWRRDQGRCVQCGSRENIEYDHIVPVSKGGSNTARNVELLCEKCNRSKCDNIQ